MPLCICFPWSLSVPTLNLIKTGREEDRNGQQNTQHSQGTTLGVVKVAFGAFLLQEIGAVILPRDHCKKVGQHRAVNPD